MTKKITRFSLQEIVSLMQKGEVSPLTVLNECLNEIYNTKLLNAYITVCEKESMQEAEKQLQEIGKNRHLSLFCAPIAVKDLFCTKDIRTTAASNILRNFYPSYESTVTQNIKNHGAIIIGKTNMDAFGMGGSNTHSDFGACINPLTGLDKQAKVPGGSSGGSAAAVASYTAYGAISSDTGGSTRMPAAFCGIVGVMPSWGRISRWGMIPYASSLDRPGVMARSVTDSCIILDTMMGQDYCDMTLSSLTPPKLSDIKPAIKGKRIGFIEHILLEEENKHTKHLLLKLQKEGAILCPIQVPDLDTAIATYYTISSAEAFSNMNRYDGIRYHTNRKGHTTDEICYNARNDINIEVRRRIAIGAYVLSSKNHDDLYLKARKIRNEITSKLDAIFQSVDVVILPTTRREAFNISHNFCNPVELYAEDKLTILANLANLPGISIPTGYTDNKLPIGTQIWSKTFDEVSMIEIAKAIELICPFSLNSGLRYDI